MADDRCACGAAAGPLGLCADYYHTILAEEQSNPEMYPWHAPVVCAYLLQHPAEGHQRYLDFQFRMLQFYLDQGLEALHRFSARQVARNNHRSHSGLDTTPLEGYAPLPQDGPPQSFRASFSGLPVTDGSFVFDSPAAYGRRIQTIAEATLEAWRTGQR